MFVGCTSLTSINLGNINTPILTDMSGMFVLSIDLSLFDDNKKNLFFKCYSLKELDLDCFNTSSVTNM